MKAKLVKLKLEDENYQRLIKSGEEAEIMHSGLVTLKPGESVGKHSTHSKEEIIIVLEGEGTFIISGAEEIRLEYDFWGNYVNLIEKRPHWEKLDEWTECRFAQFRYDPETEKWALFWPDSSGNLHSYEELVPEFSSKKELEELIEEVDRDPTGIFWG